MIRQNGTQQSELRTLNEHDLAQVAQLPRTERIELMRAILSDLQSVELITSRDAAGIARQAASEFRAQLQGRTVRELAAAYIELRVLGVQTTVIDALESMQGKVDNLPATKDEADLDERYREQLKRMSCPGCGEKEVFE